MMMKNIKSKLRTLRRRLRLLWNVEDIEKRLYALEENLYAELEAPGWKVPKVMTREETLRKVIDERMSVCRFGDGEFSMVGGKNMLFQQYDTAMQNRMREILANPIPQCLCCIEDSYGSLAGGTRHARQYCRQFAVWAREKVLPLISEKYEFFGNTGISRPYIYRRDKAEAPRTFDLWKELIKGKNVLIVEGKYTRLGVGNDLFDGARTRRRILCPPVGAFAKYDEIMAEVRKQAHPGDLIMLALGGTATIMAYDLAKEGYWAVDTGHVDIEYMWMKMGATEPVPVKGKYVAESSGYGDSQSAGKTSTEQAEIVAEII